MGSKQAWNVCIEKIIQGACGFEVYSEKKMGLENAMCSRKNTIKCI